MATIKETLESILDRAQALNDAEEMVADVICELDEFDDLDDMQEVIEAIRKLEPDRTPSLNLIGEVESALENLDDEDEDE